MIEYLSWDSHFFSLRIGKVEIPVLDEKYVQAIFQEKLLDGYDLVYLFTSTVSSEIDAMICKEGAFLVDQKITYAKEVNNFSPHELPNQIRYYSGPLTTELLELAIESGHESRFKKDSRLQPKFTLLYKTWIEKSLTGEMADVVIVYETEQSIKAFITLKKKDTYGQIGLIAVNQDSQGKGIGKTLMLAAENWYLSENLVTAKVITQKTNTIACNLYEKSGYSIESKEFVYHL